VLWRSRNWSFFNTAGSLFLSLSLRSPSLIPRRPSIRPVFAPPPPSREETEENSLKFILNFQGPSLSIGQRLWWNRAGALLQDRGWPPRLSYSGNRRTETWPPCLSYLGYRRSEAYLPASPTPLQEDKGWPPRLSYWRYRRTEADIPCLSNSVYRRTNWAPCLSYSGYTRTEADLHASPSQVTEGQRLTSMPPLLRIQEDRGWPPCLSYSRNRRTKAVMPVFPFPIQEDRGWPSCLS
jgi:hypothetical protein